MSFLLYRICRQRGHLDDDATPSRSEVKQGAADCLSGDGVWRNTPKFPGIDMV
jgi:hypothetical protein